MAKTKIKRKNKGVTIFICLMLLWPLLHTCFFTFYMHISNLRLSLFRYDGSNEMFVGLMNYKNILDDIFVYKGNILDAIGNSFVILPVNLLIILPLATIFSYFLYKKIWGYKFFRVVFFLPSIISVVVLIMIFKYMFDENFGPVTLLLKSLGLESLIGELGWFGTKESSYGLLAFYFVWSGLGYNILLLQGAIVRIPEEIIESGQIDGIGMTRELFQIVVPLMGSTISTMVLFGVSGVFTMFVQPQLMFGTSIGDRLTIPLYIVNMTKSGGLNGQAGAATMGVMLTIVGAPIMIFLRWFLNKITPEVEY